MEDIFDKFHDGPNFVEDLRLGRLPQLLHGPRSGGLVAGGEVAEQVAAGVECSGSGVRREAAVEDARGRSSEGGGQGHGFFSEKGFPVWGINRSLVWAWAFSLETHGISKADLP